MSEFLPFTRPCIDEQTIQDVAEVLRGGWVTSGPKVQAFEQALAQYVGANRQVRVMTSATAGLEMALKACGVGPGDEVIVPAMSFACSANVVVRLGARVVFVDVDLRTRNLSVAAVAKAITARTKVIMPVHFAGLSVDMDGLLTLAKSQGIRVLEDAAHAIGSAYQGRRIGSFGDITSFSFHANKNLTCVEGGALCYTDPAFGVAIERERFHGIQKDADGMLDVVSAGGKSNLTDVAAAVGLGQLRHLEAFNQKRRALAHHYCARLSAHLPAERLPAMGDDGHSFHMFAPLLPFAHMSMTRVQFIAHMREHNIGIGVHYPSIPALTFYRALGYQPNDYPNALQIGAETVTLPLFPAMELSHVDRVVDTLLPLLPRH
jgi:dTDP-4-amino-4,6-dideoxygalactose transaminase